MFSHQHLSTRKRRTRFLAGVAGLLLILTGCTAGSPGEPTLAASASKPEYAQPAFWTGTVHVVNYGSNAWLQGGYSAEGHFWFHINKFGYVSGHAVVTYTPVVNLSGANDILGYAQNIGVASLSLIPTPGYAAFGSLIIQGLFGFTYKVPNPMPIKSAPIAGSLRGDTLRLHWDDKKQVKIPITFYADYLKHNKKVDEGPISTDSPWPGTADIHTDGRIPRAVHKEHETSKEGDTTRSSSVYWGAHQIPNG